MDREKTMEFLRGMKFMQRKEEARRRETLQAQQGAEIRHQVEGGSTVEGQRDDPSAGASSSQQRHGPTIIAISGNAGVALGYRASVPRRHKFSGSAQTIAAPPPREDTMETLRAMAHEGALADNDGPPFIEDITAHVTDSQEGDQRSSAAPKRFVIPSSVRAPPMPRGLARQVQDQDARKKRERDDEDYNDPRMRF